MAIATPVLGQEEIASLRSAIAEDVRRDVVDAVREVIEESKKNERAQKEQTLENPNAVRYTEAVAEVRGKAQAAHGEAQKQGYTPGERMARLATAFVAGQFDASRAMDVLRKQGDTAIIKSVERAMELQTPQFGGVLVPETFSMEVIELLRPLSVVASIQPQMVPLNGILHMPRVKAGMQGYWRPPQGNSTKASRPTLGRVTLNEKALTVVVAVPERMLQVSAAASSGFVLNEVLQGLSTGIDRAFFEGAGDEYEPLGAFNLPATGEGAPNWVAINAAPDWTLPLKMRKAHASADGSMLRPFWAFNPDLEYLLCVATPNAGSNPIWLDAVANQRKLLGAPVFVTNNITTAGTSNNPTKCAYIDAANYLMGEGLQGYEFAESTDAGYYDESGTLVSAFANNERVMRVIKRGDFAPRQPKSVTLSKTIYTS